MGDPPDPVPPDKIDLPPSEARKRPHLNSSESEVIPKKTVISPASSTQYVYVVPQYANNKDLRYEESDLGPFVVHVTKVTPDPASGTSLRLLKLAQMIFTNKVCGITSDGIKSTGRNKASIEFKTARDANCFLTSEFISKNNFEAKIPFFQLTKMGIVKDIPVEWSMEELVNSLEYPPGIGQVIKARRLNRKTFVEDKPVWVPTRTVSLTFKGKLLPKRVYCFNASIPVDTYQLPTIQCRACCRFGHTQNICRSNPRCYRCAQPHLGSSCSVPEEEATCMFCTGQHFSTNKKCPEHGRQNLIKTLVSEESISYNEAAQRVPKTNLRPLYSDRTKAVSTDINSSTSQPSSSSQSQKPMSSSYRKIVSVTRRPRSASTQSYNSQAHNEIISNPPSSLSNGCALGYERSPPNDNLLELMLTTMLNMITKFDDALPYNILHLLQKITEVTSKHYGPVPSMECEECPSQKE